MKIDKHSTKHDVILALSKGEADLSQVAEALKDDLDVAKAAIRNNKVEYNFISERLQFHPEVLTLLDEVQGVHSPESRVMYCQNVAELETIAKEYNINILEYLDYDMRQEVMSSTGLRSMTNPILLPYGSYVDLEEYFNHVLYSGLSLPQDFVPTVDKEKQQLIVSIYQVVLIEKIRERQAAQVKPDQNKSASIVEAPKANPAPQVKPDLNKSAPIVDATKANPAPQAKPVSGIDKVKASFEADNPGMTIAQAVELAEILGIDLDDEDATIGGIEIDKLICPVELFIMQNPVKLPRAKEEIDVDHYVEQSAFQEIMKNDKRCPVTQKTIEGNWSGAVDKAHQKTIRDALIREIKTRTDLLCNGCQNMDSIEALKKHAKEVNIKKIPKEFANTVEDLKKYITSQELEKIKAAEAWLEKYKANQAIAPKENRPDVAGTSVAAQPKAIPEPIRQGDLPASAPANIRGPAIVKNIDDIKLVGVHPDSALRLKGYHTKRYSELEGIDNPESLFQRGHRLLYGNGIDKNVNFGWRLILEAAEEGHPVALALCYLEGKGIARDYQRGVGILAGSANLGHAIAQHELANCYWDGRGFKQNYDDAIHYYLAAAENGYGEAQCVLGNAYLYGFNVSKDLNKAIHWCEKAVAQGWNVAKGDLEEAKKRLRQLEPKKVAAQPMPVPAPVIPEANPLKAQPQDPRAKKPDIAAAPASAANPANKSAMIDAHDPRTKKAKKYFEIKGFDHVQSYDEFEPLFQEFMNQMVEKDKAYKEELEKNYTLPIKLIYVLSEDNAHENKARKPSNLLVELPVLKNKEALDLPKDQITGFLRGLSNKLWQNDVRNREGNPIAVKSFRYVESMWASDQYAHMAFAHDTPQEWCMRFIITSAHELVIRDTLKKAEKASVAPVMPDNSPAANKPSAIPAPVQMAQPAAVPAALPKEAPAVAIPKPAPCFEVSAFDEFNKREGFDDTFSNFLNWIAETDPEFKANLEAKSKLPIALRYVVVMDPKVDGQRNILVEIPALSPKDGANLLSTIAAYLHKNGVSGQSTNNKAPILVRNFDCRLPQAIGNKYIENNKLQKPQASIVSFIITDAHIGVMNQKLAELKSQNPGNNRFAVFGPGRENNQVPAARPEIRPAQ